MTEKEYIDILHNNLLYFNKGIRRLFESYKKCSEIKDTSDWGNVNFDEFELLMIRYARASDMLIHKIFRSIDIIEMEDGGTLIDVINRAEKRELIDSALQIREIKELRNRIAHEYIVEQLKDVFMQVLKFAPVILETGEKVNKYCEKFGIK